MMRRLTRIEVLSTYRVRGASSVAPDDARLGQGGSVAMLHSMAIVAETAGLADAAAPAFVEWPDSSLGTVFLDRNVAQRERNLVASYEVARDTLERLALHDLALDERPH